MGSNDGEQNTGDCGGMHISRANNQCKSRTQTKKIRKKQKWDGMLSINIVYYHQQQFTTLPPEKGVQLVYPASSNTWLRNFASHKREITRVKMKKYTTRNGENKAGYIMEGQGQE